MPATLGAPWIGLKLPMSVPVSAAGGSPGADATCDPYLRPERGPERTFKDAACIANEQRSALSGICDSI